MLGANGKVRLADNDNNVYIDSIAICGSIKRPVHYANAPMDLAPVIEVLSPGKATWDRGDKRRVHLRASTVQPTVFVVGGRVEVERWTRVDEGGREPRTAGPGTAYGLPAMGVSVEIDALYEGTGLGRDAAGLRGRGGQCGERRLERGRVAGALSVAGGARRWPDHSGARRLDQIGLFAAPPEAERGEEHVGYRSARLVGAACASEQSADLGSLVGREAGSRAELAVALRPPGVGRPRRLT